MNAARAYRLLPAGPEPQVVPVPTALTLEIERIQTVSRTRASMTASVVVHALAVLLLVFAPRPREEAQAFTEITMLDPGTPTSEPAAAAMAAPQSASGAYRTNTSDERFVRHERTADVTPVPASADAFADRLQARLATIQQTAVTPLAGVADAPVAGVLAGSASRPATVGDGGLGQRVDLRRGGSGDAGPAIALTRGPGLGARSLAPATVAERPSAPAPAEENGASLRRTLAGAQLAGPVADRPVLSHRTPDYPEWAMREGVEGSVTLHFIVQPDGAVKENILVEKTSGFEDFDESARRALRDWRFQPLTGGRTGEQWGNITFHFRIREAG
jgi:TonB family protein